MSVVSKDQKKEEVVVKIDSEKDVKIVGLKKRIEYRNQSKRKKM